MSDDLLHCSLKVNKIKFISNPHLADMYMNHSEVINNTSAKQTIQLHQGQHFFQRKNELP